MNSKKLKPLRPLTERQLWVILDNFFTPGVIDKPRINLKEAKKVYKQIGKILRALEQRYN